MKNYNESSILSLDRRSVPTSRQWNTALGLFEAHYPGCGCSYCEKYSGIGRKVPGNKAWNSWWIIHVELLGVKYYLRYHSIFYRKQS